MKEEILILVDDILNNPKDYKDKKVKEHTMVYLRKILKEK
ncbi:MAG: hypothetical protein QG614_494 [Patescibacteria group bacterium]|nr:hypothetical protein [Patescibacteria group bacterium]